MAHDFQVSLATIPTERPVGFTVEDSWPAMTNAGRGLAHINLSREQAAALAYGIIAVLQENAYDPSLLR